MYVYAFAPAGVTLNNGEKNLFDCPIMNYKL